MNHLNNTHTQVIIEIAEIFKKHELTPNQGGKILTSMLKRLHETKQFLDRLKAIRNN